MADKHVVGVPLQSNLQAAELKLDDEDYQALASLSHQARSVPAKMWLKPETGPYKTEEDVWDKGFPGGI